MARTTLDIAAWILRELRRRSTHFRWTSADLGVPRVDLEDREALQSALDEAQDPFAGARRGRTIGEGR